MPDEYDEVRETLDRVLDRNRESLIACVAGLPESDVRRSLVASRTTLLGLLKHAAAVERLWFQERLAGLPPAERPGNPSADDFQAEFERLQQKFGETDELDGGDR